MKIVNIKAYKYEELSEDAQDNFVAYMYDYPFDCENNEGEFEEDFLVGGSMKIEQSIAK